MKVETAGALRIVCVGVYGRKSCADVCRSGLGSEDALRVGGDGLGHDGVDEWGWLGVGIALGAEGQRAVASGGLQQMAEPVGRLATARHSPARAALANAQRFLFACPHVVAAYAAVLASQLNAVRSVTQHGVHELAGPTVSGNTPSGLHRVAAIDAQSCCCSL